MNSAVPRVCYLIALATGLLASETNRAEASLKGLWQFDNSGTVGLDTSGFGNTLSANGDAVYSAAGHTGGSLTLDGAGDYLSGNPFPAIPTGVSNYSISAWIKPTATTGARGIVGWGNYGNGLSVNAFRLGDPSRLVNYWWGSDLESPYSPANLGDGNWHHVVATSDAQIRSLWVDGKRVGFDLVNTATHATTPTNFAIGRTCDFCGGGEFFQGAIDDVAVFDNVIPQSQINAINAGASPNALSAVSPLVGLWQLDNNANLGQDAGALHNDLGSFGTTAQNPSGKYSGALSLTNSHAPGQGNYLALADGLGGAEVNGVPINAPLGDESYTLAAWIKPTTLGSGGILGWGEFGALNRVQALRLFDNGFRHYWWGADLDATAGATNLLDGEWHHIAATYDGTTRSLWLDGQLINSDTPTDHLATPQRFRIGNTNHPFGDENFNGLLDDVAVFRSALSQSEIQTIMSGDFAAYGVPEPSSWVLGVLGLAGLVAVGCCGRVRSRSN